MEVFFNLISFLATDIFKTGICIKFRGYFDSLPFFFHNSVLIFTLRDFKLFFFTAMQTRIALSLANAQRVVVIP
jgi:hypothetical protein